MGKSTVKSQLELAKNMRYEREYETVSVYESNFREWTAATRDERGSQRSCKWSW